MIGQYSVMPCTDWSSPDCNDLHNCNDKDDEATPKVVHQREDSLASRSDIDSANGKPNQADDPGDHRPVLIWIEVAEYSDDASRETWPMRLQ